MDKRSEAKKRAKVALKWAKARDKVGALPCGCVRRATDQKALMGRRTDIRVGKHGDWRRAEVYVVTELCPMHRREREEQSGERVRPCEAVYVG